MSDSPTSERLLHVCPDCRNQFVQPFVCTTCGAQKLYDATVKSQGETIVNLRRLCDEAADMLETLYPGYIDGSGPYREGIADRDRLTKKLRAATGNVPQ
jgi:hypothetical protein